MKKAISGAILAFGLIAGITIASTTTQAQDNRRWERRDGTVDPNLDLSHGRNDPNYRARRDEDWNNRNRNNRVYNNGGYNNSSYQYDLNRGYQQGINTGATDAQRGQGYSPQRSRYYNTSSQAFREGFVRGYDQGYRQYAGYNNGYGNGRYGTNGSYGGYGGYGNRGYGNQYELDRGYRQGLETGASDGQRGQNYSPERSRYYRGASSQAFREGFVRGYDQGYRQYSRNGSYRRNSGIGTILGGILGGRP